MLLHVLKVRDKIYPQGGNDRPFLVVVRGWRTPEKGQQKSRWHNACGWRKEERP